MSDCIFICMRVRSVRPGAQAFKLAESRKPVVGGKLDRLQAIGYYRIRKRGHMQLKDNTKKTEERKNRFNGESVMLTAEEARRHDNIFINELAATLEDQEAGIDGHSEKWKAVRRDLDWFRQHNASAYMVLLD